MQVLCCLAKYKSCILRLQEDKHQRCCSGCWARCDCGQCFVPLIFANHYLRKLLFCSHSSHLAIDSRRPSLLHFYLGGHRTVCRTGILCQNPHSLEISCGGPVSKLHLIHVFNSFYHYSASTLSSPCAIFLYLLQSSFSCQGLSSVRVLHVLQRCVFKGWSQPGSKLNLLTKTKLQS